MKKKSIAKVAIAVLSIMAMGCSGTAFAACGKKNDPHVHSYGDWAIVGTKPTMSAGGTAERTCPDDGEKESISIPNLSDASTWAENKSQYVAPTHSKEGSKTYSSQYGSVTITVPKDADAHSYGAWSITVKPTLTSKGTISRSCVAADAHAEPSVEIQELAALSDSSVWSKKTASCVAPTHSTAGKDVYTSIYGDVEVTIPADANAHSYGEWSITVNPTLTSKGTISRSCVAADAHAEPSVEIQELAALSDSSVWSKDTASCVAPTHKTAGKDVYTSAYGTVEVVVPAKADAHTMSVWNFVEGQKPTLTAGGKISRTCVIDGAHAEAYTEEMDVPALSDTSFWTKTVESAPTHLAAGKARFENDEYDVSVQDVVLAKQPHTLGGWVVSVIPTETTTGTATKTCTNAACAKSGDPAASSSMVLPVLANTDFWTKTQQLSNYDHIGADVYYNEEFNCTVKIKTADKQVTPYDSKLYSSVEVKTADGNAAISGSWNNAILTVGNEGFGAGTAVPFRGKLVFTGYTPATGYVQVTHYGIKSTSDDIVEYDTEGKVYHAYVDTATGILVLQSEFDGAWSKVNVAIPVADAQSPTQTSCFKASQCAGELVISYTDASSVVTNILVTDDGVVFGVSLSDLDGTALTAENCFGANSTVVIKKGDSVVKCYAKKQNGAWVVADGLQGKYVNGSTTLTLNGAGIATITGVTDNQAYTVAENTSSSKKVGIILNSVYNEYTLSGDGLGASASFTVAQPTVSFTLNFNGTLPTGTASQPAAENKSKFVPITLSNDYENATHVFRGWFTDAACTQEAPLTDGKFIPASDTVLYAKWSTKITMSLSGLLTADANKASFVIGEGDKIGDYLTIYADKHVDTATNKYFGGWFSDAEFANAIDPELVIDSSANGRTIYAKWIDNHALYGTYSGRQLLSSSVEKSVNIQITVDGKISGKIVVGNAERTISGVINGTVDAQTQVITWSPADDNTKSYRMWFDASSGILVMPDELTKTAMENYPNVLSRVSAVSANVKLDFAHTGIKVGGTKFVSFADGKIALLVDDKIYGDVTLTDAYGTAVAFDAIENQKTIVAKQGSTQVFAIGTTADKFTSSKDELGTSAVIADLDGHQGKYTVGDVEYKLDGVGNVYWAEKKGAYTLKSNEGGVKVFEVFVREIVSTDSGSSGSSGSDWGDDSDIEPYALVKSYKNVEYYVLTLGANPSFEKPEVTVKYVDGSNETSVQVNIKVEYTLSVLQDTSAKVFRGWYASSTEQNGAPVKTITLDGTVAQTVYYVKWLDKVTLTVDYKDGANDASRTQSFAYGSGEIVTIANPTRTDYRFLGWYTDAAYTDSNEWSAGASITADTTIYAKWAVNKFILTAHYNDDGATPDKSQEYSALFKINFDNFAPAKVYVNGKLFIGWYKDAACTTAVDFEKLSADTEMYAKWEEHANHDIVVAYTNTQYKHGFAYDETNKWYASTNYHIQDSSSRMAFIPYVAGIVKFEYQVSSEGKTYDNLYIEIVKGNTTTERLKVGGENGIADKGTPTTWTTYSVEVNGEGEVLCFRYSKDNSTDKGADTAWIRNIVFVPFDATLKGDYTCEGEANINLDGKYTITKGDKTGTYMATQTADEFDVYFIASGKNTAHYTMTIDRANKTYVFMPVTKAITYNMNGHGTAPTQQPFTNVEYTLPTAETVTEQGWLFKGWYANEDCTGSAVTKVTPTADGTYTYYAKWVQAFTLTLENGNGVASEQKVYEATQTVNLANVKPSTIYNDGKLFVGWFTDQACTTTANFTSLTADTTIYAKWETHDPYTITKVVGEYGFVETSGVYASNNQKKSSTVATMTVEVYVPGILTLQYQVSSEGSDYFKISVGSTQKVSASGKNGIETGGSYLETGWKSFEVELTAGQKVSITYKKDGSVDTGADTAWIRNLLFIPFDMSVAGDYTCEGKDNINLNGKGTITQGSVSGTYEAVADTPNTYDVFFKNASGAKVSHYTLVIDKTAKTYTLTAVTKAITFDMQGHGTAPTVTAYTGVEFTLPTAETITESGYVFKGWFDNAACTGSAVTKVTPAADGTYTYYAKWVQSATVTIVYGNTLNNREVAVAVGDSINLDNFKPAYTNGQSFDGWYTDSACTEANKVTTATVEVSANISYYAKWKEGATFVVESKNRFGNAGHYTESSSGVWQSTPTSSGDDYLAITVMTNGTLTFKWKAKDGCEDSEWGASSVMYYKIYNTEGIETVGYTRLNGSVDISNSKSLDSCVENSGTINVTAGTIVYIVFNRASAGSNACAKIYDISLS